MKITLPFPKIKDSLSKDGFSAGLDIGTQAMKLVILKFAKEQVELCDFKISLTGSVIDEDLLRRLRRFDQIQSLNLSVSGPATIIRYVNFPRMDEQELKNALKFEAQKHIPFSIAEVNLDSYILKEDISANNISVLLAAAKKEAVRERLTLAEKSGLRAAVVDIDSIALVNAFNFNNSASRDKSEHKACALLNIGSQVSNLNVLEDNIPRLSRDIHIAGNSLTQKIAETCGVDQAAAENLKINSDKDKIQNILTAAESIAALLAAEIRGSFDYYESQSASSVSKIYLSGGSVLFSGFKDILANLLGIEVDYWDPFQKIIRCADINAQELIRTQAQMAVAVGLALRK